MPVDPAQLDDLFAAVLAESDDTARATLVDQACAGNSELRERLEALLAAHEAAGSFLHLPADESTPHFVPLSELPGTTIGRYKLLEQIGEGGFGVVFMAEQERPVRRRVALKVIKLGMDTKQVVARFEAERQALALMDHPNIAKVFDAGATDAGRPYFVMELVRGMPITEYCDQARLSTNDRLALFQSVCSAVQHAHQKGIIHRDLKPSNVLVTLHDDKAVPKVIDFGVAKATQARLTERTLFTEFRQMIGTPSYMSPEQAQMSGLDIDTRSDVYSLGVLLYELLTGTTPIDAKQLGSSSYDDLRRLICEVEPPSPSQRLSSLSADQVATLARERRCESTQLAVHLRSDLDWIVMKCLEKDRTRRYESASALAQDLQRYLEGQPVEARSPTRWYRLRKFVRRNKFGVIAGATIVTALTVGLAIASFGMFQARRQAVIAEAESARSEQVASFLKDMLSAVRPGVARGRDTVLLREILDQTAKRVDANLKDQPEVQGDLWSTLAGTYKALDDWKQAAELFEKAAACYEVAGGTQTSKMAVALTDLGDAQFWAGNSRAVKENVDRGLEIARQINDPKTLIHCLQIAEPFRTEKNPQTSEKLPYLEEALRICIRENDDPQQLADLKSLIALQLPDADRSLKLAEEALQFYKSSLNQDDDRTARCLYYVGQVYARHGENDRALQALSEAVNIDRTIYPVEHSGAVNPMRQFAAVLVASRRADEGEAIMLELVDRARKAVGVKHETYLSHLTNYVYFMLEIGKYDRGLLSCEEAISLCGERYGPNDGRTINMEWQKAQLLRGRGNFGESQRLHKRIAGSCRELIGADDRFTIAVLRDYALLMRFQHDFAESLAILDELIERVEHLATRDGPQQYRTLLADLRNDRRETVELASKKFLTENDAVRVHINNGDYDGANSLLDDLIPALPSDEIFVRDSIAFLLATSSNEQIRNGSRALELANQTAELSKYKDISVLDTLAAAYAETGDFDAAVKWEEKAVDLCPAGQLLERNRDRLQFYRNKKRWWIERSAWALATSTDPTIRDGKRALEIALRDTERLKEIDSSKLDYRDALQFNTLAAAYAETGDFDNAVTWLLKAIECARPLQKETFEKRLESYRNKKRWWVKE